MAVFSGSQINITGISKFLDTANEFCYVNGSTNWKIYKGTEATIAPDIYDPVINKFVTDGISDKLQFPKIDFSLDWGKSLSIHCTPTAGSYILNDNGALVLYFTANRKINLLSLPPSHTMNYSNYSCILIDANNDITLLALSSNNNGCVIKLDVNGNVYGCKMDSSTTFAYIYGFGKMVESAGYQYIGTFRGYSKSVNFLNYDTYTGEQSAILNAYNGDLDVDDDYIYLAAANYEHKAYKCPKATPLSPTIFGNGTAGNSTSQLSSPRGISAGTNYVFVSDTNNHRVMVLNKSDMTYYTHLGVTGTAGSTDDKFNQPRNNIVKNGYLYVADLNNQRVKIYNEIDLTFVDNISAGMAPTFISVNTDYIAMLTESTGLLKVIKLSDKSLTLTKQFTVVTNGITGYYLYGCNAARKYGTDVHVFDRNGSYYYINSTTLEHSTRVALNMGDVYDAAVDATHFYLVVEGVYGFKKVLRSNNSLVTQINKQGTGDGQFGAVPNSYKCGISVDNFYVYVSDYSNNRIQVFNKSDLSFYSSFGTVGSGNLNFNAPGGIEVYGENIYICDYTNNAIKIYSKRDLSYITKFVNTSPTDIRIDNDEIYVWRSNNYIMNVYDLNTYELLRFKNYASKVFSYIGGIDMTSNFEVLGDKIFLCGHYRTTIIDKVSLEIESDKGPWYSSNLVDTSISDSDILIDIVFTSDYKVKVYANGIESNTVQYTSAHNLKTSLDTIFGNFRSKYSNVTYNWIALFDKERTLAENAFDYEQFKHRF